LVLGSRELRKSSGQRCFNRSETIQNAQWRRVIGDCIRGEDGRECVEIAAVDTEGVLRKRLADLFRVSQVCEFADFLAWEVGR
jgi:hypothetical protein